MDHMIKNNADTNRYELTVDGHVSFATYRLDGNQLFIDHVFVPPELRGRGVAAEVMKGVVEDATKRGLTLVPICPYAVSYLKRQS